MKKIFFIILTILVISIIAQNATDKVNNTQNNDNATISDIINELNDIITNKTGSNSTEKIKEKEFNLTESLINFFTNILGQKDNTTNKTKDGMNITEEGKKFEERRREEEKRREKMEKMRMEVEKIKKEKEQEKKLKLEKEREIFEQQIENLTVSEFTNLYLEGKSGELLYHNITKPGNLTIVFLLTDSEKTIHLTLNGPIKGSNSSLIKSFRAKNFLYYIHYAQYVGQYSFFLNNYHNRDPTEVIFAIYDDSVVDEKLGKKNIDKISKYLKEIDKKFNKMKSRQNIINRKNSAHNESVNKHNKEILIYSIVEVIIMSIVFVIQTCYIKSIVEKL